MQALFLDNGQLSLRTNYPKPIPNADEALIQIICAGICTTDLEIVKGYAGFSGILGHEFVGIVKVAQDKSWVGKRVVGTINLGCHTCQECLSNGAEHCPNRTALGINGKDGVFADYITLPIVNLLEVPENVTDEEAVFTEPLAAALRIQHQIPIHATDKIAVVGPGRLGLLIGQVLALKGAEVTMLGRRISSLALPERLGLQTNLVKHLADDSFDLVVEATGNEAGFRQSLRLVRPRGTLILKSTFAGSATIDLTKIVVAEINVVGSRCGPFKPALQLLATKAIDVQSMIDGEYTLADIMPAFTHAAQSGVRKILLKP